MIFSSMNADAAVSPDSPPVAYLWSGRNPSPTSWLATLRGKPPPDASSFGGSGLAYLKDHPEAVGIVPIENSSGGIITATVDPHSRRVGPDPGPGRKSR
ncbi:MAG: hypothetical protein R3F31_23095 [Verrucomicrobiales bacterium]